jgi:hypothetical protein
MFVAVFLVIFIGYPVAFALGGTSLLFAFIGVELGFFDWHLLFAIPERIFGVMSNYVLLAVPFFIFMGIVLEKAKLAEDLLTTIGKLFGGLRGGLALGVVFVGTLLAAATGVVGASVVAMGSISLPVMLKYGYSKQLSCGIILASAAGAVDRRRGHRAGGLHPVHRRPDTVLRHGGHAEQHGAGAQATRRDQANRVAARAAGAQHPAVSGSADRADAAAGALVGWG